MREHQLSDEINPHLLTIGYERQTIESYLNQLKQAGVILLCDVRRNPVSRKSGFSKRTLSKNCEDAGIRYEHLPELGIPTDQRRHLETQADYDTLFATYKKDMLPTQAATLETIREWMDSGERVALTCYERMPQQCHRRCVAEAIEQKFGQEYAARHL